ncbi:MAG: sugar phosphate isomerase/epimerase [Clostridia bacterium]|nr:sugar phosphate isomerase/epimerase [Clostridia bacterium]
MKICVSSYSYAQYTRAGKMTLHECVAKAKEMGFDAMEFIDMPGETYEERMEMAASIRETAAKVGIEIIAYTISANLYQPTPVLLDAEVERLKAKVDEAEALRAKIMRHDACWKLEPTGAGRSFDRMLPTIAAGARRVSDYAASKGIRTCTENHGRIAQDSDRMERLFNAVAHDNYGLLVDIGNFVGVGENNADAVGRLAPYATHVHVKDLTVHDEPFDGWQNVSRNGLYYRSEAVGEGNLPIKRCLLALKTAGYNGALSIEYEAKGDCIEGIARSRENLCRMLDELGWK